MQRNMKFIFRSLMEMRLKSKEKILNMKLWSTLHIKINNLIFYNRLKLNKIEKKPSSNKLKMRCYYSSGLKIKNFQISLQEKIMKQLLH